MSTESVTTDTVTTGVANPSQVSFDPGFFGGSKGQELSSWLVKLQLVFDQNGNKFNTDKSKITYAITKMTGFPMASLTPDLELSMELPEAERPVYLTSWASFKDHLKSLFGDPNRKKAAEMKLRSLRQGRRSVNEYTAEFWPLARILGWDESALVSQYRLGLKREILDLMGIQFEQPETVDAVIKMARILEVRLEEIRYEREEQSRRYQNPRNRNRQDSTRGQTRSAQVVAETNDQVIPMELDAAQLVTEKGSQGSTARGSTVRGIECWYCHARGHIAQECPKKAKKKSGNSIPRA